MCSQLHVVLFIPISCQLVTQSKSFFFQISKDEVLRLVNYADAYEVELNKIACLRVYKAMLKANDVRTLKKEVLKSLVEQAKEACEAE